jgi:hypothetical protein
LAWNRLLDSLPPTAAGFWYWLIEKGCDNKTSCPKAEMLMK